MDRAQIVDVDLVISAFLFLIFLSALIQIVNSYLPRVSNLLLSEARQKELLIFSSQYLKNDMTIHDLSELATLPLEDKRVEVEYRILGFEMPFRDNYVELTGRYLYFWRDGNSLEIQSATDSSEFWANFSLEFPGFVKFQILTQNLENIDSIREVDKIYGSKVLKFSLRSNRSVKKVVRITTFSSRSFLVRILDLNTDEPDLNVLVGDAKYNYHYGTPGTLFEKYYGLIYYSVLHTQQSYFPIEVKLKLWYK